MVTGGCDRIMELIDPSCKIEAKSYALDLARMSVGTVAVRKAQIRIEAINESTPPENIFLAAERALPKVEALLGLCQDQNGRRGPRGRKMIQFDLDQVRMFGQIGLTDWEMAARTIERARKRH
jgi:hypothetical protein